ncbi:uncharacterized protein G2W53_002588 [Senna tora]|uniref:Transmembrane protein n=1 Tax=Senna tora TaxID=362788 RepID=A0A834X910_9FABA|nr:uncharacterized protein G2W53_002588 [Senna tora]
MPLLDWKQRENLNNSISRLKVVSLNLELLILVSFHGVTVFIGLDKERVVKKRKEMMFDEKKAIDEVKDQRTGNQRWCKWGGRVVMIEVLYSFM